MYVGSGATKMKLFMYHHGVTSKVDWNTESKVQNNVHKTVYFKLTMGLTERLCACIRTKYFHKTAQKAVKLINFP